jgi:hypothetical protein
MYRNVSRFLVILGAALLACAPSLHAQTGSPVRGDVNGDGQVTAADARIVSDFLVGKAVPAGIDVRARGDVNGDGRVTSLDVAIINAAAAGRDVSRFPVGKTLPEGGSLALVKCVADVRSSTLSCGAPGAPAGVNADVIVGGQHSYVEVTSSNVASAGGIFSFDVTLENLIAQAMGVDATGAPVPSGIQIFFHSGPNTTLGTGIATVANADGTGTFTGANQPYFQYAGPLLGADGKLTTLDTSGARNWQIAYAPGVAAFDFTLYVSAPMQYEAGWVDVDSVGATPHTPSPYTIPSYTLKQGQALPLVGVVRNAAGRALPPAEALAPTWSATAHGDATVDANTGVVTATDVGRDTIIATSGPRTGRVEIVVVPGPAANIAKTAGDAQTATVGTAVTVDPEVTVTDANNDPVPGVEVVFAASGNGTVANDTTITDANGKATPGDWTLATTAGANTLTATAGALSTIFTATGTAAGVDHFVVEAAVGGNIPDQLSGTPFSVKVTAKDVHNNTATSFVGKVGFTTTPPGGITAGAGPSLDFVAGVLSSHAITIVTADTFTVTATRTGGTESGTSNSFEVQAPPTAVADGPTPTSVPGEPYHGVFNTLFTLAAPGIMANDTRGLPLAMVTSFGGGSVGGSVTTHPAGESAVSLPGSGSLKVRADGSVDFMPPTGFTGLYTFQYRISNVRGTSDAQVTIAVGVRPAAVNDAYPHNLLGNVPINTDSSSNFTVTTNDQGDARSVAIVPASAVNGQATLNADGTFAFLPAAGHVGPASFTYTVTNGFGTSAAATVSMTVSGIAWFVKRDAAAGGDGRFDTPFNDLSVAFAAGTKPLANQPIFLYHHATSYTGGVTLLAGQRLVGQGAAGTFASAMNVTWPVDAAVAQPAVGGTNPTVVSGLTLGNGNTLQGFDLTGSGTLTGTSFGTLIVSGVGINTTGRALNLTTGTISGSFPQVRSTGGANNVFLSGVSTSGTTILGTNADVLSGATGDALVITGGNGSFTYAGSITNTATLAVNVANKTGGAVIISGDVNPAGAARGISVTGNSSGTNTITFSGASQKISSGTAAGVNLTNNTGATIGFTGGNLAITTTSGAGFNATGGGTVSVTGNNNTVNSTGGGTAVNIQNTSISGVTLLSVNASGGGANGIVLASTGSGAFVVTGDGASDAANTTRGRTTAKSGGGTLALGSGGTITGKSGDAINLNNTGAVTLRNVVLQSNSGDGVDATTVSGLTLDNLRITTHALGHGLHATSVSGLKIYHSEISGNATDASTAGSDIWNVRLDNVTGTDSIQSSLFQNSLENLIGVINSSGTLNLTVANSTITGATAGNGVSVFPAGTANVTANFQGDSLAGNFSRGIQGGTGTTTGATFSFTVNNSRFINNFVGVEDAHGSSGPNTFSITSNNFQTNVASSAQAININRLGADALGFTSFGVFSGTITGNTIGTAGVANSGSDVGDGITVKTNGNGGVSRFTITNNTIREFGQHGISVLPRDATTGHTLEARIQNNNIANGEAAISQDGINATLGALNTDKLTVCLDIATNTVVSAVRNGVRVRSSGLPAPAITLTMPSYDGTGATYLANRNPAATGAGGNTSFSNTGGTTSAGSCTTP